MTGGAHGQQQYCCALPHEMGLKSQFLNCITDVSLFKLKSITAFTAKIAKLLISNQVLLRYQVFVHLYACHTALCKFLSFFIFQEPTLYIVKGMCILDYEGNRILAKYYDKDVLPTTKEQKAFEKNLFNKTHRSILTT